MRAAMIRPSISSSACAAPPAARARLTMSKGIPSTQWAAVDHITAKAIQYQTLENEPKFTTIVSRSNHATPTPL
jgi:hypothetical protein